MRYIVNVANSQTSRDIAAFAMGYLAFDFAKMISHQYLPGFIITVRDDETGREKWKADGKAHPHAHAYVRA